eukprot:PhF_6_TR26542/c0_g1_i1/m.38365
MSSISNSIMVPRPAVLNLYRRYLKSAIAVPNTTIRLLLLQQIRMGFRRHRLVISQVAQRELIQQAFKDLEIIEDPRHAKTLYVNKYGMISCLEWEVRRTEFHFQSGFEYIGFGFMVLMMSLLVIVLLNTKPVQNYDPALTDLVDYMADRLESPDNPAAVWQIRQKQTFESIETMQRQRVLEARILSTFHGAPQQQKLPSLRNPAARDDAKEHVSLKFG